MAKFALTLVLVALSVAVQARPSTYDAIVAAAKSGNWDAFQQIINENLADNAAWQLRNTFEVPVSLNNIRNLKPFDGGRVYGEAEFTYSSSSNVNGQETHESGGHKVINNNGKVNEFDIKPTAIKAF